jgi:hypothetical protein
MFENGSKLRIIDSSALAGCKSLISISIPHCVEMIEKSAFKGCNGLESCLLNENAIHLRIGADAFSECCCLRSFAVPRGVEEIGRNCFKGCTSLRRLMFQSAESLAKVVGNVGLDQSLEYLGFIHPSCAFKIEIDPGENELDFC